ncbi:MAG: 23S rRNA (guanosine(2251)-2'-O)-methyltransferase RlmB [Burkholderiales bacterium]
MARGAIVYGFHAVTARLRHRPQSVREILIDDQRHDPRLKRLTEAAAAAEVKLHPVLAQRLDDLAHGARHQGVVALVDPTVRADSLEEILSAAEEPVLVLVLDGVQDPHNLGACLRVADALGAHAVVAPKDRAVGITPTVEKVASGAAETVPYVVVTNLARALRELKAQGVWVVGADQSAQSPLPKCDLMRPVALVLGAEGQGLRRLTAETCDELTAIPMLGTVGSLNVSVAAGICLYEARRQRKSASGTEIQPISL